MKNIEKVIMTLSIALVFFFSSIVPAIAENLNRESASDNSMVIVTQGDGYVVETAKDNMAKKVNKLSTSITPKSTTYYSINQNGSGTFSGTTRRSYSNGELQDSELRFSIANRHDLVYQDWLGMTGQTYAFWSGTTPYNATSITIQPSQKATASSVVTSPSLPAGISATYTSTSETTTWPQVVINNNHVGSYAWEQIDFYTGGHFTDAQSKGSVTWLFGTTAIGQSNIVDVTIN